MKTSELTGALLDYWVARAAGVIPARAGALLVDGKPYFPSTNWAHGGPIIEHARIELRHFNDGWCAQILNKPYFYGTDYSTVGTGGRINTPLIAAMRCYVASKFGDEVPDDHEAAQPAAES